MLMAVKRMEGLQTASHDCVRLSAGGEFFFMKCWTEFAEGMGIAPDHDDAAHRACLRLAAASMCSGGPLQVEDWECMRSFFREKAEL